MKHQELEKLFGIVVSRYMFNNYISMGFNILMVICFITNETIFTIPLILAAVLYGVLIDKELQINVLAARKDIWAYYLTGVFKYGAATLLVILSIFEKSTLLFLVSFSLFLIFFVYDAKHVYKLITIIDKIIPEDID